MYIVIRRQADLRHLDALKDKECILTRFVMKDCSWCHASQPAWDTMTKRMTPQLEEHDALVEVESQFVDKFREYMARHRKPYPHIQSYPSVYIMSRGTASPHVERDTDSFVRLLQQMKMIREREPETPQVRFMEKTLSPLKEIQLKSPVKKSKRTPLSFTVRRNTPRAVRSKSRSTSRSTSRSKSLSASPSLGYTRRKR